MGFFYSEKKKETKGKRSESESDGEGSHRGAVSSATIENWS